MALGALIIKARLGLTDEELVQQIKENPNHSSSLALRSISIQHRLIRR